MYWLYLIIFILIVLVPDIITQGVLLFDEERLEEIAIFFLGTIGFLIYLWKENQLNINLKEKVNITRESTRISRDLTDSYSYIGEMNRKSEIIQNILIKVPENILKPHKNFDKNFKVFKEAIKVLGKSHIFSLCFVDTSLWNLKKEIKSSRVSLWNKLEDKIKKNLKNKNFLNDKEYLIAVAPKKEKIRCLIIVKEVKKIHNEDKELILAIANQARLVYLINNPVKSLRSHGAG